ncbi:hypothetical protein RM190_02495 [Paracoccus sp. CPCC 101403]|uniref:Uncharacterized protein n=1 Tax=Paracoccus broussonetiae TaxID=3075834 RepID=A0ABU3E923_9RHOB|nr:hypothetical protein [Paracoccus sp. CPCC 101403]MDT1060708.1 hypothetical protein [Paracoccus sp. CPCC 101403]
MTRHIADRQHETGAGRIRNFTRQDREATIHPAIQRLLTRRKQEDAGGGRRMAEFLRIERGQNA